jgi:hypothetical protein
MHMSSFQQNFNDSFSHVTQMQVIAIVCSSMCVYVTSLFYDQCGYYIQDDVCLCTICKSLIENMRKTLPSQDSPLVLLNKKESECICKCSTTIFRILSAAYSW